MFFTIKLYLHLNHVLMLNWIVWNRTIFIKMDFAFNNPQRLICHKNQTSNQQQIIYFIYMKVGLEINNLQCSKCHKTKPNQTKPKLDKYLDLAKKVSMILTSSRALELERLDELEMRGRIDIVKSISIAVKIRISLKMRPIKFSRILR